MKSANLFLQTNSSKNFFFQIGELRQFFLKAGSRHASEFPPPPVFCWRHKYDAWRDTGQQKKIFSIGTFKFLTFFFSDYSAKQIVFEMFFMDHASKKIKLFIFALQSRVYKNSIAMSPCRSSGTSKVGPCATEFLASVRDSCEVLAQRSKKKFFA